MPILKIEVEIDVGEMRMSGKEVVRAVKSYQATEESPTPDEEWVNEEVALNRLGTIRGVQYLKVAGWAR